MDIKQLKFLVALDETRHFGQAAARCHVTQPTLSMRLRQLEDELAACRTFPLAGRIAHRSWNLTV
jgi:DNA-binding transcriptional LysR family regulator